MDIFHFIWIGYKKIPATEKNNILAWANCLKNTLFKLCVWYDNYSALEDLLMLNNDSIIFMHTNKLGNDLKSNFYQWCYQTRLYPQAGDYLRMVILNKFGGIYLDCDISPKRNCYFQNLEAVKENMKLLTSDIKFVVGYRRYTDGSIVDDVHMLFAFQKEVFDIRSFEYGDSSYFSKNNEEQYKEEVWNKIFTYHNKNNYRTFNSRVIKAYNNRNRDAYIRAIDKLVPTNEKYYKKGSMSAGKFILDTYKKQKNISINLGVVQKHQWEYFKAIDDRYNGFTTWGCAGYDKLRLLEQTFNKQLQQKRYAFEMLKKNNAFPNSGTSNSNSFQSQQYLPENTIQNITPVQESINVKRKSPYELEYEQIEKKVCVLSSTQELEDTRMVDEKKNGSSEIFKKAKNINPNNILSKRCPGIALEWDYEKNGTLTPDDVTVGSAKRINWKCGKRHRWGAPVNRRTDGTSVCKICHNREKIKNDSLKVQFPEIAAEWDYKKNGGLTPGDVTRGSNKDVWWKCEEGHTWREIIKNRVKSKNGCLICSNEEKLKDDSLQMRFPNIAAEWNYKKNGGLTPGDVSYGSKRKVWWKSGKIEWEATIHSRTIIRKESYKHIHYDEKKLKNDSLEVRFPDIALEWDYEENGDLTPNNVVYGSNERVGWICKKGHKWKRGIRNRTEKNYGCPECHIENNSLQKLFPAIAAEWDHERNGNLKPNKVSYGSSEWINWKCREGHTWGASVYKRSGGAGCPVCRREKIYSNKK